LSVFNDDRKTEIIGETWIQLDQIIVPGGGQSDTWHSLNCKGRYAGEIRIELTYYDTRPREEVPQPTAAPLPTTGPLANRKDAVGGPRQAQSMMRRPLPADPSYDPSPTRPSLPEYPQSSPLPRHPEYQDNFPSYTYDQSRNSRGHLELHMPSVGFEEARNGASQNPFGPDSYDQIYDQAASQLHTQNHEVADPVEDRDISHSYEPELDYHSQQPYEPRRHSANPQLPREPERREYDPVTPQYHYNGVALPELPPSNPRIVRPTPQPIPVRHHPSNPHTPAHVVQSSHSSPSLPQSRQAPGSHAQYSGSPKAPGLRKRETAYRQQSVDENIPSRPTYAPAASEDGPPPPPPAHRSSGFDIATPHQRAESYVPPLSTSMRGSKSGSPLPNRYPDEPVSPEYPLSASPSYDANYYSPTNLTYEQRTPTADRHDRMMPSEQSSPAQYSVPISPIEPLRPTNRTSVGNGPVYTRAAELRQNSPTKHYSENSSPLRHSTSADANTYHDNRAAAPASHRREVSPGYRPPLRKSVSPQPEIAPSNGGMSGTPFSPDSYDLLNPHLETGSLSDLGARYTTPEQAKYAARERAIEEKVAAGPIIGTDGRVIDPSDHLPTDTWAPEPEQKPKRKGPEITFRFRHSPQGAQPMPAAGPRPPRETVIRPHSIATTAPNGYSAERPSGPDERNRLQKKTRPAPAQTNSSPVTAFDSRASPTAYPLREHVNYHGYNNATRGSPGAPPPIPAKVPLGRSGQEEWDAASLTDEISRIDIGTGSGTGRIRKSRFGA
jgi:hypothetical protein